MNYYKTTRSNIDFDKSNVQKKVHEKIQKM